VEQGAGSLGVRRGGARENGRESSDRICIEEIRRGILGGRGENEAY